MVQKQTRVLTGDVRDVVAGLTQVERQFVEAGQADSGVFILRTGDPRGYYIASTLLNFEREIRRTSAEMSSGIVTLERAVLGQWPNSKRGEQIKSSRKSVYPAPPARSSLELVAARQGSSVLELVPTGEVVGFLTSVPVTVLLNSIGLYQCGKTVRVWIKKPWQLGKNLLAAVAEAGDAGPEAVLNQEPDVEAHIEGKSKLEYGDLTIHGPADVQYVVQYPDGTASFLNVTLYG